MPLRFLLPLLLIGPTSATPRVAPVAFGGVARADTVADTTFYITNRTRKAGRTTRAAGDTLEFGYIVTRFIDHQGSALSDLLLGRVTAQRTDSVRLTHGEFVDRLRATDARAAAHDDGAVLYVHGYATSFGRAMSQSAEIAHRGGFSGPFVVFAWPAHTALATWPTPRMLISHAYRDDSVMAQKSGASFRAALAVVREAVRPGALTVIGHSMGAQLVGEALRAPSAEHDALAKEPLHALAFFAADVNALWFRDSVAPAVAPLAARRVVYASGSDRMLGLSRLVNHSPRLGQMSSSRYLTDAGVEVVDVSQAQRASSSGWAIPLDMHHAMRLSGAALFDFFYGVVNGQSPTCRSATGLASRDTAGVWRLRKSPIPRAAGCVASGD